MTSFEGRKGSRSKEQIKLETMRRAAGAQSRHGIGGREKTGQHAPKPITLPQLKSLEEPSDD